MQKRLIPIDELLLLINSGKAETDTLKDYHDSDIAEAFKKLELPIAKSLAKLLGAERISEILSYNEDAADFITELGSEEAADILENMESDDAAEVLSDIEEEKKDELLSLMDKDAADDVKMLDSYQEDEVGRKLSTSFVSVKQNSSVKEAMRQLIAQAEHCENIATIYAVDANDRYVGAIELNDLIIARNYIGLDEIIKRGYPSLSDTDKIPEIIGRLEDYNEDSIPVVDKNGVLLGIITHEDILEEANKQREEDYAKLAGLVESEDIDESLSKSLKKRLPWLILLLGLSMVVSTVVGLFENLVSQVAFIVCFQSLILGMAGNVGTQSLAVTIRVLSEDNVKNKRSLVFKEIRVGLVGGLCLGILSFLFVLGYLYLLKTLVFGQALFVAVCVGLALALSMLISSMVGTLVPLIFDKLKIDPAVASGPLITTINDLTAVIAYYGLAALFLSAM